MTNDKLNVYGCTIIFIFLDNTAYGLTTGCQLLYSARDFDPVSQTEIVQEIWQVCCMLRNDKRMYSRIHGYITAIRSTPNLTDPSIGRNTQGKICEFSFLIELFIFLFIVCLFIYFTCLAFCLRLGCFYWHVVLFYYRYCYYLTIIIAWNKCTVLNVRWESWWRYFDLKD